MRGVGRVTWSISIGPRQAALRCVRTATEVGIVRPATPPDPLPKPDLSLFPPALQQEALECLKQRNASGFLCKAGNAYALRVVESNMFLLRSLDLYEDALLLAYMGCRVNHHGFPLDSLRFLFDWADRERLRASGEPLPGPGPFILYRGVAGKGPARRVRGISWTKSVERAIWFANRARGFGLHDPGVYRVEVEETSVLTYVDARQEDEFLIDLPSSMRPTRVKHAKEAEGATHS